MWYQTMANGFNMGDLSSPLLVLGGLYYAGENKRKFTGGMDGLDILAGGFGGASAQWAGGQVQDLVGMDMLTDELSQALVGAALSEYGDQVPYNRAMARGIHLNVAQQTISDAGFAAGDLFGDILGGGGSSTNTTTTTQTQTVNEVSV